MRLIPLAVLALLPAVHTTVAHAQSVTLPVTQGTRVRVSAANLVAPLIANFLQMRGDTAIFIEDASGTGIWSIHVNDITKLERSNGERRQNRSYVVRGAAWGAMVGATAGLAFSVGVKPSDPNLRYSKLSTTAIGAGAGALLGGAIGTRFAAERWTKVSIPRRLALVPARRGASVSLGWTF